MSIPCFDELILVKELRTHTVGRLKCHRPNQLTKTSGTKQLTDKILQYAEGSTVHYIIGIIYYSNVICYNFPSAIRHDIYNNFPSIDQDVLTYDVNVACNMLIDSTRPVCHNDKFNSCVPMLSEKVT